MTGCTSNTLSNCGGGVVTLLRGRHGHSTGEAASGFGLVFNAAYARSTSPRYCSKRNRTSSMGLPSGPGYITSDQMTVSPRRRTRIVSLSGPGSGRSCVATSTAHGMSVG